VAILDGALYELEHTKLPNRKDKTHASNLSPYPAEFILFKPMDRPDNGYGQLHKPISAMSFNEAGMTFNEASVHGFIPLSSYRTQDARTLAGLLIPYRSFHWPMLSEFNNKLDDELWESDPDAKQWRAVEMMDEVVPIFPIETAPGPPPAAPNNSIPAIPSTNSLNSTMILSEDRLFFISIPNGTNNVREWHLVQLMFEPSVQLSPSCMQTGKF